MKPIRILGISASLRNARFGGGGEQFVSELSALANRDHLSAYLAEQSRIILHEFFEQGRKDATPFDEMLTKLRSARGDRGLSNSEAALGAALWGARSASNVEIRYCGLSAHFPAGGGIKHEDQLREAVLWADGYILSGPVYFGDRGSLAQSFIEFISIDTDCRKHIQNKVFGGVTVGAKRNGGQETTLIYQIVDAGNLGMLPVGNDASTTSQYGGTVVAGDVGTFEEDAYGIDTCIGTGIRVSKICRLLRQGEQNQLLDPPRIAVWLLQDDEHSFGLKTLKPLLADIAARDGRVQFDILDFNSEYVHRCLACDICPTDVGTPTEYRCIVRQSNDLFVREHEQLLSYDALLVAAYSPKVRNNVSSVYQKFIERTRYLRRDDYRFSDRLCAPLVISEIGSNQNLHLRMLTSMVRHDTVLHHPMLLFKHDGKLLNRDDAIENGISFCSVARTLSAGRLADEPPASSRRYKPVGYVVSMEKSLRDEQEGKFAGMDEALETELQSEREKRLLKG